MVALTKSSGVPLEYVRYSSYGEPTVYPVADLNMDGAVTSTDQTIWNQLAAGTASASAYTRDIDFDGAYAAGGGDAALFTESYSANSGKSGKGKVSTDAVANRVGYAAYQWDPTIAAFHVRYRVYKPEIGRWTRRDPLGYVDGGDLYEYVGSRAIRLNDPTGLFADADAVEAPPAAPSVPSVQPSVNPNNPLIPDDPNVQPNPWWRPLIRFPKTIPSGLPGVGPVGIVPAVGACVVTAAVFAYIGYELSDPLISPIEPAPIPPSAPRPRKPQDPCSDEVKARDAACGGKSKNGGPTTPSPPFGIPKGFQPGSKGYCDELRRRIENALRCLNARERVKQCYSQFGPDKSGYDHDGEIKGVRDKVDQLRTLRDINNCP